jgi:hypothetical protein
MQLNLQQLAEKSTVDVDHRKYPFYWQADNYKFNSMYLARWYEKQYHTTADFVARDFEKIKENLSDKTIDTDYNYNIDYIKKLRKQYSDVKLMFSGGYDSVTVFYHFVDNNVLIDETVTMMPLDIEPEIYDEIYYNVQPLIQQYSALIGKHSYVKNTYKDCKQFWKNHGVFFNTAYGDILPPPVTSVPLTYFRPDYSAETCYIKGIDKPQLVHYNGNWYVTAIEDSLGTHVGLSNAKYFWLDADNIKSLIQDARKYRDHLYNTRDISGPLQFFKFHDQDHENSVVSRRDIPDQSKKLKKGAKEFIRRTRLVEHERYDIMKEYCECIQSVYDVFPESTPSLKKFMQQSKFAWFIDIDSLNAYTQQELIPEGFV